MEEKEKKEQAREKDKSQYCVEIVDYRDSSSPVIKDIFVEGRNNVHDQFYNIVNKYLCLNEPITVILSHVGVDKNTGVLYPGEIIDKVKIEPTTTNDNNE